MKKLSVILMLFTFVGGIIAAESRFNQSPDVAALSERIRLLTIEMHLYAHDDMSLKVTLLEGNESLTQSEKRQLSYYRGQRDKIALLLEKLDK